MERVTAFHMGVGIVLHKDQILVCGLERVIIPLVESMVVAAHVVHVGFLTFPSRDSHTNEIIRCKHAHTITTRQEMVLDGAVGVDVPPKVHHTEAALKVHDARWWCIL